MGNLTEYSLALDKNYSDDPLWLPYYPFISISLNKMAWSGSLSSPIDTSGQTLWLVDTHSLIFQVFHAIPMMTSPRGLPVNAVFGIARDLLGLRDRKPTYLLCAMDRAEPTFRSSIFPAYKAHRPEPPADLIGQFPLIEQLIEALGIPLLSVAGYEADDLIATVATYSQEMGILCHICTSDKDCRQLLSPKTFLFNLRKGTVFGTSELFADWGIRPDQVVDLQAMVGDSVDNVPGVPGIGYKTAAKLLQDFGTLEGVFENVSRVPGAKKQEALKASIDQVSISRKLVQLERNCPISRDWESWRLREPDYARLYELFRDWGFRTLSNQMEKKLPKNPSAVFLQNQNSGGKTTSSRGEQSPTMAGLFDFSEESPKVSGFTQGNQTKKNPNPIGQPGLFDDVDAGDSPPVDPGWDYSGYEVIETEARWESLLGELKTSSRFAIDLETTALDIRDAEIVGISLCFQKGRAFYLPLMGPKGASLLSREMVLEGIKPLLEGQTPGKINQNIKYDMMVFAKHGIFLQGIEGDSMIVDYLLHAGERSHGLDELSKRYLNHRMIPITDLIGPSSRKEPQRTMNQVPVAEVGRYACEDADAAWQLHELLFNQLQQSDQVGNFVDPPNSPTGIVPQVKISPKPFDQVRLYREVEIPLLSVLASMEMRGIRVDKDHLFRLGQKMGVAIDKLQGEIYELAGGPFDIQSLPQLRVVLFNKLGLPALKKTGITKEPSTDQETLEKLAALDHPGAAITRAILDLRKITKLKSTYVDTLPTMVHPSTGRVHASFHQTVAATGRLSSSDPNLQNIPVRDDMGLEIRRAFLPEEGWDLWTADYSQIELRLLAHLSRDNELRAAYIEGQDIHTRVAASLHGVAIGDVTSAMRRVAKTVNFGVVYGISAHGLAERLAVPRAEAEKFIEAYFRKYPGVLDYQEMVLDEGRKFGFVQTILGRRRRVEGIRPKSSYWQRNQPEREAINMVVQGSAADLIKIAMIGLEKRLSSSGLKARLLLQIHDELVLEAPPDERAKVAAILEEEMVTRPHDRLGLDIPLSIDVGFGPNWVDTQAWMEGA